MRTVVTAMLVALLTGALLTRPAYSQANNLLDDGKPPVPEERRLEQEQKAKAAEDAYRSATTNIPSRKPVADPWGDVRGADQKKQTRTSAPRNERN
jgi:hypothetical protein